MQSEDSSFQYVINGNEPVSITDVSEAFKSLQSVYRSAINADADLKGHFEQDLYIDRVAEGSQIYEMISIAAQGALPMIAEVNTASALVKNIRGLTDYFLRKTQAPKKIRPKDCVNAINVVMPAIVSDGGVAFGVVQGGIHIDKFVVSGRDAERIISNATREKALLEAPDVETRRNMVLRFIQANAVKTQNKGTNSSDKGIIADISSKPQSIIFSEETIGKKASLLKNHNFYNSTFLVDVEVARLNGDVKAYVINNISVIDA
ncbi:MAG: hypothetical protein ACSHX3_09830 [Litorimonas sp.]